MRFISLPAEERERRRTAARDLAERISEQLSGEEVGETLIGAVILTEHAGVLLAVIIAPQDQDGPLFRAP